MRKSLTNIFDEANADEIDNLVKQNKAPNVSADTLLSVKDKVYAKTHLQKEKKINLDMWMRFGSITACFCLILVVSIMAVYRFQNESVLDAPDIPPVTTNDFY